MGSSLLPKAGVALMLYGCAACLSAAELVYFKNVKHLMAEFDRNLLLVLAAYNAGPSAVRNYQGIPPFAETREYIRQVLQFYRGEVR